jgi:hypothetical protein
MLDADAKGYNDPTMSSKGHTAANHLQSVIYPHETHSSLHNIRRPELLSELLLILGSLTSS